MVEYKEQNNNDGIVLSIIIPCFNQGEFILDAISSVEKCREDIYEIIIINDGSTEPLTQKVLASLSHRGYFVIDQSKQGPSKARNLGIEMAKGRYILPLDADNKIRPDYIPKGIEVLNKFPEVGVVYGNPNFFDERTGIAELPDLELKILLRENYIDTCAVFRKIVWENCGGYDLNIFGHEDWEFWLHAVKKGWKFYHLPEVMFDYRVRLNSRASFGRLPENRRKIIQYICNKHPGLFIPNLADIISEKEFVALSERERAEGYHAQLQGIQIELEKSQSRQQKIQAELERSQSQQQQTQAQLEHSQSQLQQTQAQLERSQFQLQQTQAQLEHSQSQLQQTQTELERSQAQQQQTQAQLERSQFQLQQTQAQLERSQSQQQQTQAQLEHSQSQLQQTQAQLEHSQSQLQQTQTELERSQSQVQLLEQRIAQLDQQQPTQKSNLTPSPNFIVPQPIDTYEAWLRVNQWNERSVAHLKSRLEQRQGELPKISVVMPVYNPQVQFLELAIASVVNQVYQNWELCIADDCSTDPAVHTILNQWAAKDERIRVIFREENGNISRATNSAASLASGDFLLFLDHDDELSPDALGEVGLYVAEHPETDFLYSDDDKIDTEGHRYNPHFKPDWSPELFLSYNYFNHLCAVRRRIFEQLGGTRVGFETVQDHDLALRATEISRHIAHLPLILYHWRAVPGSLATSGGAKPAIFVTGQKAVQEALDRRGISAIAYQPEWAIKARLIILDHQFPDTGLSVSIIIPTKNQLELLRTCLYSLQKTTYQNYQIVIIDNESDDPQTLAYLESLPHQVLRIKNPENKFNFAAINNRAAQQVESDYLLFLNNDTEVISPRWLSQMVGYAQFQGVGAVGAKLLYPDNRIQHAGVIHGLHHGLAGHAFKGASSQEHGYFWYIQVARNYSAVTAACLLTPRHLFLELGGFDEYQFAVAYNDVDYCYRLHEHGYRSVYCPSAELIHRESFSRKYMGDNPRELAAYRRKYASQVDSFYSPHSSLEDEQFRIQPRRFFLGEITKRLRVLMCSHLLDLTGAPLHQYEIAVQLASDASIEPVIFCVTDGPLREDYERDGIKVIIRKQHPLANIYQLDAYQEAIYALSKELSALQIDVMYVNTLDNFFLVDCAQMMGIPCIWNVHESEPWKTYFQRFGLDIAARALECFRFPYRIIFGSEMTRREFEPLNSHHNFTVIHNGLHLEELKEKASAWTRERARQSLNVAESEIVLLLLGTVCDRKGQHDLPLALTKLPKEWYRKIKVFIVGDRPDFGNHPNPYSVQLKTIVASLPEALKQNVAIVPETRETAQYYRAADIFVFTSRLECFPRVIQEAMAYGLPIITTPVFGIKEQVQNGVNALFYSTGNVEELAAKITLLLQDEGLRSRFAENSHHVLACLNNFEDMVQSYAQIFREAYFTSQPKKSLQQTLITGNIAIDSVESLRVLLESPPYFTERGETEQYYQYIQKVVNYLYDSIRRNPESKKWQDIALFFTLNAKFRQLYLTTANLRDIYSKRAEIMEFALSTHNHQIDYEFPPASPNRTKIRLGVLQQNFQPQAGTFAILASFEYLDKTQFEIILYAINVNGTPLEQYCQSCANRLVQLPNDLRGQVQTLRADDLDVLLIGDSVTGVPNAVTLLALHRLARVQVAGFTSPVTTGIRNIDYYLSATLIESAQNPQKYYGEKLILLEGTGFCFSYPQTQTPTIKTDRTSLGIPTRSVVFISCANYYKITPELRETWAKIVAQVPNAVLVLLPFNPSGSQSYSEMPFINQMRSLFAKYGIAKSRLLVLAALPTRLDVQEVLKLGDVYLDSYPYAGSASLVDALEVGLPTVVMEGNFLRSRTGSAIVRSLQMPELITDTETGYIRLAIALGTHPELRLSKRAKIQQKIQEIPEFLNSRAYAAQLGSVFKQLLSKPDSSYLPPNFGGTRAPV